MWVGGIVYEGGSLMNGRGAGELTARVSEKGAHPFVGVCLWDSWGRVFVRMEGVGQTMVRGLSVGRLGVNTPADRMAYAGRTKTMMKSVLYVALLCMLEIEKKISKMSDRNSELLAKLG
ncbi:hypothetical protein RHSIM_Rhsim05G0048600 [Rhododendron simsii]|uniref:Uncharacterized protein n=1 Tax=Rhododendron simsii TaxID=118357 RepID=A0A834LL19_RHOSS|nr:hypothetical protein RHSIM_Rhsim05G0048600 [Rhododendron simsii]